MVKKLITMDMPIASVYHDYKLVADSITDDESFQKADAGILLSNLYDVVKVLEKQMPKEPRFYNCNYYCPVCDDLVGCHDTIMKWDNKFCKHCGQAIKWE